MKIAYRKMNLQTSTMDIINSANEIIEEMQAQGFELTLRQLYYQFVARDWLPNTPKSYDRLAVAISNGRLCGHIDWDAIVDRTRTMRKNSHWGTVRQPLSAYVPNNTESIPALTSPIISKYGWRRML